MVNVLFLALINKEMKGLWDIYSVNFPKIGTVDAFPS